MSLSLLRLSLSHLNSLSNSSGGILVLLKHWLNNKNSASSLSNKDGRDKNPHESIEEETSLIDFEYLEFIVAVNVRYFGCIV